MQKPKSKSIRYYNLFKRVKNWHIYLVQKILGFGNTFTFNIRDFGLITVSTNMLGPFRENFLDEIYLRHIPKEIFSNSEMIIIDIGANVGFFSLSIFSKYPKAEIHAFEPHPYCFKILSEYKDKFSQYNLNAYNLALGDYNGELMINTKSVSHYNTTSSIFDKEKYQETFNAKVDTLTRFFGEKNIEKVNFIKLDCEGAEYSIIYSLKQEELNKICSMCVETHKGEHKHENINNLNDFLISKGFETKVFDNGGFTGYIWAWNLKSCEI